MTVFKFLTSACNNYFLIVE